MEDFTVEVAGDLDQPTITRRSDVHDITIHPVRTDRHPNRVKHVGLFDTVLVRARNNLHSSMIIDECRVCQPLPEQIPRDHPHDV